MLRTNDLESRNGVHYRKVASMTSNAITIKGGEIDVEKLDRPLLFAQRVPNHNKLTVVSGSR